VVFDMTPAADDVPLSQKIIGVSAILIVIFLFWYFWPMSFIVVFLAGATIFAILLIAAMGAGL
jgi:hypothetical protein